MTEEANDEDKYKRCQGCGHHRDKHEAALLSTESSDEDAPTWRCTDKTDGKACDCTRYQQPAVPMPMEPRVDLPAKYRIPPGATITKSCPVCGRYEVGTYVGDDLFNIKGDDYNLDEDYLLTCGGCGGNFPIKDWMDHEFIRYGVVPIEEMQLNKKLPRRGLRRIKLNKEAAAHESEPSPESTAPAK